MRSMPTCSLAACSGGLLSLLAMATACSEAPPQPALTVTDSAGVRISINTDAPVVFAELDSAAYVSIGGAGAAGPTQFFQVQGMRIHADGRLWVADGQSGELRIFEADGSHWKTLGGQGEGPGEFVRIRLLGATAGDTVLAGDGGLDRITVFDPEGEFVRTERLPSSDRPAPRPFDAFDDGSVLGQLPKIVAASSLTPGQILADSVELVRVVPGSQTLRPYGGAPGPLWLWTGRNQVPLPFTVNASFDVVGSDVHLVSGTAFRIHVFADGELREMYGVNRSPRPVQPSDIDAYRAFVQDYVQVAMHADYLSALDHDRRPTVLPGYDRLLASSDGHVWAQVYESEFTAAHDWDVYDAGHFIGQVRTPPGFYPMFITRDAVAGVWRDSLGVEHVRAYRCSRR